VWIFYVLKVDRGRSSIRALSRVWKSKLSNLVSVGKKRGGKGLSEGEKPPVRRIVNRRMLKKGIGLLKSLGGEGDYRFV